LHLLRTLRSHGIEPVSSPFAAVTALPSLALETLGLGRIPEPGVLLGLVFDVAKDLWLVGPRAGPDRIGLGRVGVFEQGFTRLAWRKGGDGQEGQLGARAREG
jgi:hypothetical protein